VVGSDSRPHPWRTIQLAADGWAIEIVDQTRLPGEFVQRRLTTVAMVADAIRTMQVRGAPLIGASAAYGICLAVREDPSDDALARATALLRATRPTAVNLEAALDRMRLCLRDTPHDRRQEVAYAEAHRICEEDAAVNRAIGDHGLGVLRAFVPDGRRPVQVLTHCNAGRLATVEWGTALAPVYRAREEGLPVHVWVSETRPRNQGLLTAWELADAGVPHTVIADSAAGAVMARGAVDVCLVGTDRTTAVGDVCNKIGTYLKALAAHALGIPFYAAVPGSSVDWAARGPDAIPIEERDGGELRIVAGRGPDGSAASVRLLAEAAAVANPAFDVTPAALVTGLITERGVCDASAAGLAGLYPERR
jgi:methylthioribose-1-phosphate isomerase